jgi:head-tail adaptor
MTASDLTEWIALFQMELIPDGQGGDREVVPADLTPDLPANVRQMGGNLATGYDQNADRVQYEITVRLQPGITSAYRVLWNEMLLDISLVRRVDSAYLGLVCMRRELGKQ